MSIEPINSSNPNEKLRNRITSVSGAGLVAGAIYTAMHENWLYKGMPSDKFVKSVSENIQKTMTSDELKEVSKINKFLTSVVDPEINLETVKSQIRKSKELSNAIKSTPDEPVETAITRVFSNPDKKVVKQALIDLQYKTFADKKADKNTSTKLIYDNFDAKNKKLVKSDGTSDEMFRLLQKTAKKINTKAIAIGGVVTGVIAGALCLVMSEVPGEHNNKK